MTDTKQTVHYSADNKPAGEPGSYRKTAIAKIWGPMPEPFTTTSDTGTQAGKAGDYLAADDVGYYPIPAEFVAKNYERVD